MLIPIGTRVRFLYTGEEGIVRKLLPGGMVEVYLEKEDMEIPASAGDLVILQAPAKLKMRDLNKQFSDDIKYKKEKEASQKINTSTKRGLLLVFEPAFDASGEIRNYRVHILNDSNYQTLFQFEMLSDQGRMLNQNGKLEPFQKQFLGLMAKDMLNENPDVISSARAMGTDGPGPWQKQEFRIKPKGFFNKSENHPEFDLVVHVFPLFKDLYPEHSNQKSSLKNYTKSRIKRPEPETQMQAQMLNLYDIEARANFKPEIDLHIEKLQRGSSKLSPGDILDIQIHHFEEFVNLAIRIGVPFVYIIHGQGSGKLRNIVEKKLSAYSEVSSFEGGYHEGYGFGATRVNF